MKIIDRYVAKNFLIGYVIAFAVLIGLRIIIDLFINIDEFAEHSNLGAATVLKNIVTFYATNSTLYFRDFAGMITVVAAAFSLGKMTRSNELTAILASGVSLKRVIAPIVFLAIALTGVLVIDQEIVIPRCAEKLVREHDAMPGTEHYSMWFLTDENSSLISSSRFDVASGTLEHPTIITRRRIQEVPPIWEVTGRITADWAIYNEKTKAWDFSNGFYLARIQPTSDRSLSGLRTRLQPQPISFYKSDLAPAEIPILRKEQFKSLLSSAQLAELSSRRNRIKDLAQLFSQKHFRITDPLVNLIMLMVGLPVLVCREPKAMKSAILKSFSITSACFITTFVCKMVATESLFNRVIPEFWAWLPIFIFLPIALIELDSMKT